MKDDYGLTREDRMREADARKVMEFKRRLDNLQRPSRWSRFKKFLEFLLIIGGWA